MANIIIGTNGSIGAGSTPNSESIQPHWKMATTTPYAAAIDSTFMMTALSGTSSDRKTIINNRNDSSSTTPMNMISRSER